MNHLELAKWKRERLYDVPILYNSSYKAREVAEEFYRLHGHNVSLTMICECRREKGVPAYDKTIIDDDRTMELHRRKAPLSPLSGFLDQWSRPKGLDEHLECLREIRK